MYIFQPNHTPFSDNKLCIKVNQISHVFIWRRNCIVSRMCRKIFILKLSMLLFSF